MRASGNVCTLCRPHVSAWSRTDASSVALSDITEHMMGRCLNRARSLLPMRQNMSHRTANGFRAGCDLVPRSFLVEGTESRLRDATEVHMNRMRCEKACIRLPRSSQRLRSQSSTTCVRGELSGLSRAAGSSGRVAALLQRPHYPPEHQLQDRNAHGLHTIKDRKNPVCTVSLQLYR